MRVALPMTTWPAGIAVHAGALRLLPDDLRAWLHQGLGAELPPGGTLEVITEREGTTETGWPLRLVEARVTRGGQVCEVRLGALYAFFEHGGAAYASAPDAATLAPHAEALVRWLRAGRPDFGGEPAALAHAYDLDAPRAAAASPAPAPRVPAHPDPRFGAEFRLARLAGDAAPAARLERAALGLELGRAEAALAELDGLAGPAALAVRGRALAALGRVGEAAACWREAAQADPADVESRYNLGLARFEAGDPAGARDAWREAAAAAPDDFLILRKIIQAEHRLGMWADAAATRKALGRAWATTADPRARLLHEVVIDQLESDAGRVFVYETFRPRDPSFHPLLRFVAVDARGHELPRRVVIETSDYAKERGSPFVIVAWHGRERRVLGTAAELPPYPELRATALALLQEPISPASDRTPPSAGG